MGSSLVKGIQASSVESSRVKFSVDAFIVSAAGSRHAVIPRNYSVNFKKKSFSMSGVNTFAREFPVLFLANG